MFGITPKKKAVKGVCTHTKAVPRWDRMEDAGNLDRASSYYCPDCDQFLPPSALTPPSAASSPLG